MKGHRISLAMVAIGPPLLLSLASNPFSSPSAPPSPSTAPAVAQEVLLEDFLTSANEDAGASGANWGAGKLTPGIGGGSGRLGELHLSSGQTLTLDTDSQAFPLAGQHYAILGNADPGALPGQYDPTNPAAWPTVTVDQLGEGFEFSRIQIDAGAQLILTGSRPGRVFARGELVNDGVIDLSGETPAPHLSNSGGDQVNNLLDPQATAAGGPGGLGGPGAGQGGQGADRMDMTNATLPVMINIGGMFNPGAVYDGRPGVGVGGVRDGTGGLGGAHYPPILPRYFDPTAAGSGDAELSDVGPGETCRIAMVAGPGSGGSHALPGTDGVGISPFQPSFPNFLPNAPAPTPGGDNAALGLEPPGSPVSAENQRKLEFWRRHLRGGAGGGGGGTSIYGSKHNAATGPGCNSLGGLFPFWDHSAAGGGGGGGAAMFVGGRRLSITGVVDCSGGDGGSATQPGAAITTCTQSGQIPGQTPDCEMMAAPGGGGAGGALRIQAPVIELAAQAERIDVCGGAGGLGAGGSFGGDGSPGLVRLEYTGFLDQPSDAALFGPSIAPFLPGDATFNNPFTSAAILSVGEWNRQTLRPESYSGSQSCWMQPASATPTSVVTFVDDVAGAPTDLSRFGWNMDVLYDVPGVGRRLFPYRGIPPVDPNDAYDEANFPAVALGGNDFATYFGTTLNHDEASLSSGSLVAVRFQGVRATGTLADPCSVDLGSGAVAPGSLTPFVSHPALLNGFAPAPNTTRFAVVFDEQLKQFDAVVAGNVIGVTNLRIRVQVN